MKAILFLAGGVGAALLFVFFVKFYLATPEKLFFFTVEAESDDPHRVLEVLEERLNEEGLNVIRVLSFDRKSGLYATLIACNTEGVENLLIRVPFLSVLIPCNVVVYRAEDWVRISILKEHIFIRSYADKLDNGDVKFIVDVYSRLRKVVVSMGKWSG